MNGLSTIKFGTTSVKNTNKSSASNDLNYSKQETHESVSSGHRHYITIEGCCDSSYQSEKSSPIPSSSGKQNLESSKSRSPTGPNFTTTGAKSSPTDMSSANIIIEHLSEQDESVGIQNPGKVFKRKPSLVIMPALKLDQVHVTQSADELS